MTTSAEKWNARYREHGATWPSAASVLSENLHLLPDAGEALDLACGSGANALLLAEHGLQAHAWDVSDVALEKLNAEAESRGLSVMTACRDAVADGLPEAQFDVIVVSRFLERLLFAPLINALKPDGVIFYQTFTREKPDGEGPSNPDFLLASNELLRVFSGLRVLAFRDEGQQGDMSVGLRHESWIVAKKEEPR